MRLSRTSGVSPIVSRIESLMSACSAVSGTIGVESTTPQGGENCSGPAYGGHALAPPPHPAGRRHLPAPPVAVARGRLRGHGVLRLRERLVVGVGAGAFATAYTACPGGVIDVRRPQSGRGLDGAQRGRARSCAAGDDGCAAVRRPGRHDDHGRRLRRQADRATAAGRRASTTRRTTAGCGAVPVVPARPAAGSTRSSAASPRSGSRRCVRCVATRCRRDARHGFVVLRKVQRAPRRPVASAARRRARLARRGRRGVAARRPGRGVRRGRQQRHPARADRARRPRRARGCARLRLRAPGAVLRRGGRRLVRHAHVGRRRAPPAALGAGRGRQLELGRSGGAGRQHGARRARAGARGR